jgi:hypothetical protein
MLGSTCVQSLLCCEQLPDSAAFNNVFAFQPCLSLLGDPQKV